MSLILWLILAIVNRQLKVRHTGLLCHNRLLEDTAQRDTRSGGGGVGGDGRAGKGWGIHPRGCSAAA